MSNYTIAFDVRRISRTIQVSIRPTVMSSLDSFVHYQIDFTYSANSGWIFSALPKRFHAAYKKFLDLTLRPTRITRSDIFRFYFVISKDEKDSIVDSVRKSRVNLTKRILSS